MSTSDDNPYRAPQVVEADDSETLPESPGGRGWFTCGDICDLPPICLRTGRSDGLCTVHFTLPVLPRQWPLIAFLLFATPYITGAVAATLLNIKQEMGFGLGLLIWDETVATLIIATSVGLGIVTALCIRQIKRSVLLRGSARPCPTRHNYALYAIAGLLVVLWPLVFENGAFAFVVTSLVSPVGLMLVLFGIYVEKQIPYGIYLIAKRDRSGQTLVKGNIGWFIAEIRKQSLHPPHEPASPPIDITAASYQTESPTP